MEDTEEDLSGPSGPEILWDRESMVGGMLGVATETPPVSSQTMKFLFLLMNHDDDAFVPFSPSTFPEPRVDG